MTKTGNKFKKPKTILFCFTKCKYAAYLLYQHRQTCLWCYFLLKVRMLKEANFFYSESPLHAIWEQHGATKPTNCIWLDLSLLLPITNIRTLSMNPNLKISKILSVLHCIKHNGRIENEIWDSNLYPWLHRQVIASSKLSFPWHCFSIFCTS